MEEDKIKKVIELVKKNPVLTSIGVAHEADVSVEELGKIYQQIKGQIQSEEYGTFGLSNFSLNVMEEEVLLDREGLERFKNKEFVFPDSLELHLGPNCQCACLFCWRWSSDKWEKGDLGLYRGKEDCSLLVKEDVENLLNEFKANGGKQLYLSGGLEFFMSEIAEDVIKCAAELDLQIKVYTNGVADCFDKEDFLDLILDKVESIRFSMHAIRPETYANVVMPHRDKEIAARYFEMVKGRIKKMVDRRNRSEDMTEKAKIGISFLAINKNFLELEESIDKWIKIGVDSFFIAVDMREKVNWFTTEEEEEFKRIIEKIRDKNEQGFYSPMQVGGDRHVARENIKFPENCFIPLKHPTVDPWGFVYTCCFRAHPFFQHHQFELGNLHREKLVNILKSAHEKGDIPLPFHCGQCLDYELTFNRCVEKVLTDWRSGFPLESLPFIRKQPK